MKKLWIIFGLFVFTISVAFAQSTAAQESKPVTEILKGTIIDNKCANTQKPEQLATFIKTHKKTCALMPACVASGYALYTTDNKLLKFDTNGNSNARILEFLKLTDTKLDVIVIAQVVDHKLSLIKIFNPKNTTQEKK